MDFFEGRIPLAIRLVIRAVNMEILINTRFALLRLFFWEGGIGFQIQKL